MQFYYTNDWLSVYRKDFPRHPVEAIPQKVQKSEPLFAPFRQPQHLKVDNCKHLPNEPSETKSEFLKRTRSLSSFRSSLSKESKKGSRSMSSVSMSSKKKNSNNKQSKAPKMSINPPKICYCCHCKYSRL